MEVKTTVSTAELLPLISALKLEMQKKGYSPLSIRGLENVWDALLHYASTVPETAFDENFREGFLQAEYGFRMVVVLVSVQAKTPKHPQVLRNIGC